MRIEIVLPRERKKAPPFDRAKSGTITVYDGERRVCGPFPCLGKGGGNRQADSRDWRQRGNDTPTGKYIGTVELWTPADEYGPQKSIRLIAADGNALVAAQLGRGGLGIHGGRNQTMLWSTRGCLRVFNRDIVKILAVIPDEVEVDIKEA